MALKPLNTQRCHSGLPLRSYERLFSGDEPVGTLVGNYGNMARKLQRQMHTSKDFDLVRSTFGLGKGLGI